MSRLFFTMKRAHLPAFQAWLNAQRIGCEVPSRGAELLVNARKVADTGRRPNPDKITRLKYSRHTLVVPLALAGLVTRFYTETMVDPDEAVSC